MPRKNIIKNPDYKFSQGRRDQLTNARLKQVQKRTARKAEKAEEYAKMSEKDRMELELAQLEKQESTIDKIFQGYKNQSKIISDIEKIFGENPIAIVPSHLKHNDTEFLEIRWMGSKYEKSSEDWKQKKIEVVKSWGNKVSRSLNENGVSGEMTVGLDFDGIFRAGYQTQIGSSVDIYDPKQKYDEEYTKKFEKIKDTNYFIFYIDINRPVKEEKIKKEKKVKKEVAEAKEDEEIAEAKEDEPTMGASKYNDCLWFCLNRAIPKYNPWESPSDLKRFVSVDRYDPIPFEKIEQIEKKIGKVGLNITGDYEYQSKINSNLQIHLKILDNHILINHKHNQKVSYVSYKERTLLMYDSRNGIAFNGTEQIEMTDELLNDIYDFKTDYIIVPKTNKKQTFEQEYKEYIEMAEEMKAYTENKPHKINLYKTGTIKRTALLLLDELTKHITPEQIQEDEADWIQHSVRGALIFNEKYKGIAHKIDVKSMYPFIMSNNNSLVPVKRGIFDTKTNEELHNLKFFPYGIYRAVITPSGDDKIDRLFRFNTQNKYPSDSLNDAKKLGFDIEFISDDKPNCLFYPRSHCLTGHQVFAEFDKFLFEMKESKIKGSKLLINILSGAIGEISDKLITVDQSDDAPDIYLDPKYKIVDRKISTDGQSTLYYVVSKDRFFKCGFARFKPFMLSKARSLMVKYIHPNNENIVKVNTDSIISTVPLDIKLGEKMGQFALEYTNRMIKISSNAKEEFTDFTDLIGV